MFGKQMIAMPSVLNLGKDKTVNEGTLAEIIKGTGHGKTATLLRQQFDPIFMLNKLEKEAEADEPTIKFDDLAKPLNVQIGGSSLKKMESVRSYNVMSFKSGSDFKGSRQNLTSEKMSSKRQSTIKNTVDL